MTVSEYLFSSRVWTTATPDIDGSPTNVTAPAGGLYLWHSTATLSLLDRFAGAMTTAGVADADAYITEAGFVRLVSSGVFTVDWNLATTLRDLLGFTADLAAASSYTAPNRSTLLWRPGTRLTPERSPRLSHGQYVADLAVHSGPQGNQTVREEGDETVVQRVACTVYKSRYYAAPSQAEAPGDFVHYWRNELKTGQKVIVCYDATEGQSTTAEADLSAVTIAGPYVADMTAAEMRRMQFARAPGFERVENRYQVAVPLIQTAEFVA